MGKTYKKRRSCDICGKSPASYSKRTGKTLCSEHLFEALMKILIGVGAIATALYFIGIIKKTKEMKNIELTAKVKHNVFSILKVANFIRDYYNEVMPENEKICLLDMLENKAKIGCLN